MRKKVSKAIFPVAGMGTRFLPATKSVPKEIMTLVDKPLVQYAIDEARAAGIKEFIFVTSRGKSALEDYFDNAPQLEHALRKAGKTELLDILRSTDMDSGEIAVRCHPAGRYHRGRQTLPGADGRSVRGNPEQHGCRDGSAGKQGLCIRYSGCERGYGFDRVDEGHG
jgi:hypothetical protein